MMHIFQAVLLGTFTEQSGGHLLEKEERKNLKKKFNTTLPRPFFFPLFFFTLQQWTKYLWVYS